MKKRTLAALAAIAAAALVLPAQSASAQDTVPVYVAHGINVAGDTTVNVCVGEEEEPLLPGFEFEDFAGPVPLTVGEEVDITVYLIDEGDDDCGDGTLVIEQTVTVPDVPVVLVATGAGSGDLDLSGEDDFQLTPFALDLECAEDGDGRLTAIHASAETGEVSVEVNGAEVDTLEFGDSLTADLEAETYSVEVPAVVGPVDIEVTEENHTLVVVVGNIDGSDPSAIVVDIEIGACEDEPEEEAVPISAPAGPGPEADGVGAGAAPRPLSLTG